jgi:hypothetical protein
VTAGADVRDDALLATTRWTAILIVPVLTAAFAILYLFPDRTPQLWAWTIKSEMTAMVVGGGYLAGAYFFLRVATSRQWHRIGPGILAVTPFTALLLEATILHWDLFNHDHVSFWAWLVLYVVTPFLLPLLWVVNRRRDPATLPAGDVRVPPRVRAVMVVLGLAQVWTALWLFLVPARVIPNWPWALTPLTSRTLSAFLIFPAVTWLWFAFDDRWSSFEIVLQTATVGLLLIALAAVRAWDEFEASSASANGFVGALAGVIALLIGVQVAMGRRARRAGAAIAH